MADGDDAGWSLPSTGEIEQTEPADPPSEELDNLSDPWARLLAPREWKLHREGEGWPQILTECGCGGGCFSVLADPTVKSGIYAQSYCPDPRPSTIREAVEAYIPHESSPSDEFVGGPLTRHRDDYYRRIAAADRRLADKWQATTAMFTRRLSPVVGDERPRWRTPVACAHALAENWKSVRQGLRYRLGQKRGFDYKYVEVMAGTDHLGTPHTHLYVWIDDPDDEVSAEWLKPLRDDHVECVDGATAAAHPFDPEGDEGSVTVYHHPIYASIIGSDDAIDSHLGLDDDEFRTEGAAYVASQLPHLPLERLRDPDDGAKLTELAVSAIAQVSTNDWFRSTRSV